MTKYILTIDKWLLNFIEKNKKKLHSYLKKYFQGKKEFMDGGKKPLSINEVGLDEWWIKKIFDGKLTGNGNKCIDVIADIGGKKIGIDVGSITYTNGKNTNEKSLIQEFKSCGKNLDTLFKNKDFEEIKKLYVQKYMKKINNSFDKINDYYYILFISTQEYVHCLCLKYNKINISNIKIKEIKEKNILNKLNKKGLQHICRENSIKKYSKSNRNELIELLSSNSNKNIISKLNEDYPNMDAKYKLKEKEIVSFELKKFIDSNCGDVKIYKSKKRIELRLSKNYTDVDKSIKLFSRNEI